MCLCIVPVAYVTPWPVGGHCHEAAHGAAAHAPTAVRGARAWSCSSAKPPQGGGLSADWMLVAAGPLRYTSSPRQVCAVGGVHDEPARMLLVCHACLRYAVQVLMLCVIADRCAS